VTGTVATVLVLLCFLQIKHMFADYFLQTPKMLAGRGTYFHMGRAQHAGLHAVFSALVLSVMGASPVFVVILVLAEWVIHFHIDWGKARWSEIQGHTPTQAGYWRAAGLDQALHHLTYLGMAWAWVSFS
jgi:hypothetical protein